MLRRRSRGHACVQGDSRAHKTLIDYLEAGDRLDDFLEDFPTVTRGQTSKVPQLAKDDNPAGRELE